LIQISPPIEAQSPTPENGSIHSVSGDSPSLWSQKAQKKNKPGIFAKLLEGLSARVNQTGGNVKDSLKPGSAEINSEKTGKNPNKTASHNKMSGLDFFGENDTFDQIQGIFKQNSLTDELNTNQKTGISRSAGKDGKLLSGGKDHLRGAENSIKANAVNEEELRLLAQGRTAGTGRETQDAAFGANANRAGKGTSTGIPSGDKAKASGNGTADLTSFSFREMEAEYQQSLLRSGRLRAESKDDSRLSELRGKKGRHIEVRDLRTGELKPAVNMEISRGETFSFSRQVITEVEIPVNLGFSQGKGDGTEAAKTAKETSGSISFEDALARQLAGDLSTDIVREATVIVRNGGEGTIRLSLHPASLGDVKIRLEMAENKITGHIIVESSEALRAFERELPVLEKAFRDSGFSETTLDMSLAQDSGSYGAGEQGREGEFQAFTPVQAASLYESETGWSEVSSLDGTVLPAGNPGSPGSRPQVNLLV